MNALLAALAMAFQPPSPTPSPTPPRPLPSEPGPTGLTPAHDLYFEDSERLPPVARAELHRFSGCVAARSTALASDTLQRDFTSTRYRNALRLLARNNDGCFRRSGRGLFATGLPFAGSLAEHLLARDPAPLNVRLARAAAAPPLQPFAPTDRVSLCVVRSVPDEIGRLLASPAGSAEETAAIRALEVPVRACSQGGPRIEAPPAALRAMLATSAFRTVAGASNDRDAN